MPCENGCARYRSGSLQARSLRTCVTVRVVNVLDVEGRRAPDATGSGFAPLSRRGVAAPDSDKVSVLPGIEPDGLNALRLVRAGSVDYWHGEGTETVQPRSVTREPEGAPGSAVLNSRGLVFEPGEGWRWAPLGAAAGAEQLDGAVLELDHGADFGPYRKSMGEHCGCACSPAHRRCSMPTGSGRCRPAISPAPRKRRPEAATCSTTATRPPAFFCCGQPDSRQPPATPRPGDGCRAPLPALLRSDCGRDR
jgi:hypothetical protein